MQTWLDRNRGLVFGLFSALAVAGAAVFYWRLPSQAPIEIIPANAETPSPTVPAAAEAIAPTETPAPTPTPAPLRVYVTGAVPQSDVFYLPPGSIVKDAVEAAGGFTAEADRARINLALELQDQQQIHVPAVDEAEALPVIQGGAVQPAAAPAASSAGEETAASGGGGSINLNSATLEQLDTLPGIGPAIAQRIIEYRDSIGGFTAVEQITQVSGIGEATFAKISGQIMVE
jgi:competence protein ComEA